MSGAALADFVDAVVQQVHLLEPDVRAQLIEEAVDEAAADQPNRQLAAVCFYSREQCIRAVKTALTARNRRARRA